MSILTWKREIIYLSIYLLVCYLSCLFDQQDKQVFCSKIRDRRLAVWWRVGSDQACLHGPSHRSQGMKLRHCPVWNLIRMPIDLCDLSVELLMSLRYALYMHVYYHFDNLVAWDCKWAMYVCMYFYSDQHKGNVQWMIFQILKRWQHNTMC